MLARVFRSNFSTGALLTWGETTHGWGRPVNSQFFVPGAVEGANTVVQAATGQYHLSFLTKDNSVYTTGLNQFGQLGQSGNELTPQKVNLDGKVHCLACGTRHSLALTHDGSVFSWGFAQAVGREGDSSVPGRIPQSSFSGQKVTSIAAANDFSLALTEQGQLFSWGSGLKYMQNWEPASETPYVAEPVLDLLSKRHSSIKKIGAAASFVMLLLDNGRLYGFGKNKAGVFGARTNPLILSDLNLTSFYKNYDALYKNEKVVDFEVSAGGLIFRTETDRVFYNGFFDKWQPTPFPIDIRPQKIFATDTSCGIVGEDGKLYFVNDQIIEDSQLLEQNSRLYVSEDTNLNKILSIGGTYGLRYALVE